MELLRWILLIAGIIFIAMLYLFGRKRRHCKQQDNDFDEDLPEFNAHNWDDLDEGVGSVRVITGSEDAGNISITEDSKLSIQPSSAGAHPEIIALFILPKLNAEFSGSQINSSVQAMGLTFGEMNIYHFIKDQRTVFSLANMHEPGCFDPDNIHDLKSSGLTLFMQINTAADVDAIDDLTEMLQRSYQIAGLIGGRLCNHLRQPLTEQDAENYRTQVREHLEICPED